MPAAAPKIPWWRSSRREFSRRGHSPLPIIWTRVCITRNSDTTRGPMFHRVGTITPAWMCIRCSGVCWRGSFRKCGWPWGGLNPFIWWRPGRGRACWRAAYWILLPRRFGDFYSALRYQAVEVSAVRRGQHPVALARHLASGRVESLGALPGAISCGCLFSNELLDALPVRRVSVSGGALREIHVGYESGRFQEVELPLSTPVLGSYFTEQGITLHEEQQTEAGLGVCRWIRDAGRAWRRASC